MGFRVYGTVQAAALVAIQGDELLRAWTGY